MTSTLALGSTWSGNGEIYDSQGQKIDKYNLVVKVNESTDRMDYEVKVSPEKGKKISYTCQRQKIKNYWKTSCQHGEGGMMCFSYGLCQEYTQSKDGTAYVTTIAFDGEKSMRLFRVQLEDNQPVHYFAESLAK